MCCMGALSLLFDWKPSVGSSLLNPFLMSKTDKGDTNVERAGFNQDYTTAIGKGVQSELNSTLICPEVTRCFKERMREHRGGGKPH